MEQSPIAFLYTQPWINSVESSELRALGRQEKINFKNKKLRSEPNVTHFSSLASVALSLTHSPCPICCCRFRIHKTKKKNLHSIKRAKSDQTKNMNNNERSSGNGFGLLMQTGSAATIASGDGVVDKLLESPWWNTLKFICSSHPKWS